MKIESITLKGFNRISQNGYAGINIKFNKVMQIILGSNGSGKSSLMQELSPLPPASADFDKGGYKEVHLTHNGSKYVFISDLRTGHTAIKDGVVLNDCGTSIVQKSIIEKELGLTPALFDILSSNKKFTEMSPTERRDWIISLSGIDLKDVLYLYMTTKDRCKDAKVYLDRVTQRLKNEEFDLMSDSELDDLNSNLANLRVIYTLTLDSKINTGKGSSSSGGNEEARIELIRKKMGVIQEMMRGINRAAIPADYSLPMLKEQERQLNSQLDSAYEAEQEITNYGDKLKTINDVSLEELESKLATLKDMINDPGIEGARKLIKCSSFTQALKSLEVVYDRLSSVCENLINDTGVPYLREYLTINTDKLNEVRTKMREVDIKIANLEAGIEHYHGTPDNRCPKCAHVFKNLNEDFNIDKMKSDLEQMRYLEKSIKMEHDVVSNIVRDVTNYRHSFSEMMDLLRQTELSPLFYQTIIMIKPGILKGSEVIEVIHSIMQTLSKLTTVDNVDSDIAKLEQEIQNYNAIKKELVQDKLSSLPAIRSSIAQYTAQLAKVQRYIELMENNERIMQDVASEVNRLNAFIEETNECIRDAYIDDYNTKLENMRIDISLAMDGIERRIREASTKKAVYRDISDEKAKAEIDYKSYQALLHAISPNTGIIADIMNGAIENFVSALNNVINAVWTSDIEVLPCINKKNDLDWKFPVRVDKGIVRPDVSKTSTSQTDIINLAFQLIVAKTLGYSEFPLFADELGSSMDDQHRINMMKTLAEILESKQCSQIFMISHFAAMHEQFSDADIIMLNERNILNIPSVVNKHVEFYK